MNPTVRNILAALLGIIVGSAVNMALIEIGPQLIPLPGNFDPTTPEGLKEGIKFFEPKHFIFPFLAHALGTLVGAFLAAKAGTKPKRLAMIISGLFFVGGIANIFMIPSPLWFDVTDAVFAYFPMGWLGYLLGRKRNI